MVIGLFRVRLNLLVPQSLKEKRGILKRLINHLRKTHNCAVAETGFQDYWQTAELAIVTVYAQKEQVESLFTLIEKELVSHPDWKLALQEIEFL